MYHPKSSFKRSYDLEKKGILVKKREETAKVVLPPSWSGLVTVGDTSGEPTKENLNFSMGLWPVSSKTEFKGVILRNVNPIQEIRPFGAYVTNKDALQSLKSLDNRLQREIQSSSLTDLTEDVAQVDNASRSYTGHDTSRVDNADKLQRSTKEKEATSSLDMNTNLQKYYQETRGLVREFDMSRINENTYDKNIPSNSRQSFSRHDSVSTLSSYKLDLGNLDSSMTETGYYRQQSQCTSSRPLSAQSDRFDVSSLASSTGSLMFTSRESRRMAYNEIKSPRYAEEQLSEVGKLVRQLSDQEGRKRNQQFQTTFNQLCDVANAVMDNIPASVLPFTIKKVETDGNCNYETTGADTFDIYITPEISKRDIIVSFNSNNCRQANVYLVGNNPTLELFCVEERATKRKKLSPCKLMIVLAHIVKTTVNDTESDESDFPHNANVRFDSVSEREIGFSVQLPENDLRYKISLVLAIDVDDFPSDVALKRNREWPNIAIKHQVIQKGVHLTSKISDGNLHTWSVTFLKSRRTLLQLTDETGNKLRLLLALQCLRETGLSSPDAILPCHFATILFWANCKYRAPIEWTMLRLGRRFIDLVVALRRCLWKRECLDFFVPNVNLFEHIRTDECHALSFKIDVLIKDPAAFLKIKLSQ